MISVHRQNHPHPCIHPTVFFHIGTQKITCPAWSCSHCGHQESVAGSGREGTGALRGCLQLLPGPAFSAHCPDSRLLSVAGPGATSSEGAHGHHQGPPDHEQPRARSREGHRAVPQRDPRVRVQRRDRPGRGREAVRGLLSRVPGIQPRRGDSGGQVHKSRVLFVVPWLRGASDARLCSTCHFGAFPSSFPSPPQQTLVPIVESGLSVEERGKSGSCSGFCVVLGCDPGRWLCLAIELPVQGLNPGVCPQGPKLRKYSDPKPSNSFYDIWLSGTLI